MDRVDSSKKRVYVGIFLIAIGAFWILERLNLIPDFWNDILISWQMLFIVIGLFSFIGGNKTIGVVLMVFGGFFLVPEIMTIPYEIRRIGWPLLIMALGFILLVTHAGKRRQIKEPPIFEAGSQHHTGNDYFDEFVMFGGREVYVDSKRFLGGKTTSIFGGAEYDLRQAELSPNGAVIDCLSIFGGCAFKVPPDWTVKNEVTAVFGAFTDKRGGMLNVISDPSKTLVIKGFASFGGVEVKYM